MHHSGSSGYPLRSDFDLLNDLGEADDLTVRKLQVEATVKLAAALNGIAESLTGLTDVDHGLMFNRLGEISVRQEPNLEGS